MDDRTSVRIMRALELIAAELQVLNLDRAGPSAGRTHQQQDRDAAIKNVRAFVIGGNDDNERA